MITEEKGVSIIICCYNSSKRLPVTLKYIAHQKVPANILWEVIVVDNNSSDDTKEVAIQEWKRHNVYVPFKIITEQKQGLIYARERGYEEAGYDLLLFCDDDNWLDEKYVSIAFEIMEKNKNIGILGGCSKGFFEIEEPVWFSQFERAYAIGKPLAVPGIANERSYIAGAGMVIRKCFFELFESVSFQKLLTGRKRSLLLAGEDSEISLMVLFLGYDLYYDERLRFTHYMPARRLTWKYCKEMIARGHAIPQIYFDMYRYCNCKIEAGEKRSFAEAYKILKKRTARKFFRMLFDSKPFWYHASLLIRPVEGSKKEIELRAHFNKLLFLLKNRNHLQSAFATIEGNLQKIKKCQRQDNIIR